MTLKTDLKFGLLLIAILVAAFLFVRRTIDSAPLTPATLAAKLHRNMTRAEVSKVVGKDLPTQWGMGQTLEAHYIIRPAPNGQSVRFEFDVQERLQSVYIDEKSSEDRWTRTRLELP